MPQVLKYSSSDTWLTPDGPTVREWQPSSIHSLVHSSIHSHPWRNHSLSCQSSDPASYGSPSSSLCDSLKLRSSLRLNDFFSSFFLWHNRRVLEPQPCGCWRLAGNIQTLFLRLWRYSSPLRSASTTPGRVSRAGTRVRNPVWAFFLFKTSLRVQPEPLSSVCPASLCLRPLSAARRAPRPSRPRDSAALRSLWTFNSLSCLTPQLSRLGNTCFLFPSPDTVTSPTFSPPFFFALCSAAGLLFCSGAKSYQM